MRLRLYVLVARGARRSRSACNLLTVRSKRLLGPAVRPCRLRPRVVDRHRRPGRVPLRYGARARPQPSPQARPRWDPPLTLSRLGGARGAATAAAAATEADFDLINPAIHTANDDISRVDFNHVNEWVKLGIAYVVETSYVQ